MCLSESEGLLWADVVVCVVVFVDAFDTICDFLRSKSSYVTIVEDVDRRVSRGWRWRRRPR